MAAPIWIHACSVGEVQTVQPLIENINKHYPKTRLLLTVSTQTGMELATAQLCDKAQISWFPFDHPHSVQEFIRAITPKALLLVETELWPNVLLQCHRGNIPVAIVNGRLSEKHFSRYEKIAGWLSAYLEPMNIAAVQSEDDSLRFESLGIKAERITVTGNIKFDGAPTLPKSSVLDDMRKRLGIAPDSMVVVYGSTRPGDEALAYECWKTLRNDFATLRFIIVPRHLNRLNEAILPFKDTAVDHYSTLKSANSTGSEAAVVVLIDELGILRTVYALADIAVVGGSWYPGVEGHNPIEPAALGIPTIFGPYMKNFKGVAEKLILNEGALQLALPEDLPGTLRKLLNAPDLRSTVGAKGRSVIESNQGATEKTLDLIRTLVGDEPAAE